MNSYPMIRKLSVILFLVTILCNENVAQYCIDGRFDDTYVFSLGEIQAEFDGVYGQVQDWQGNMEDLTFDIGYPKFSADPLTQRPFVLYIHGGGFLGGDKSGFTSVCQDLIQRGYVCASINYRLGWDTMTGGQTSIDSQRAAIYRSVQDTRAALRYFVNNANAYGIDPDYIYVGGSSAGAITTFFTTYYTQADFDAIDPNITSNLGTIDASGNTLTDAFSITGNLGLWGAISDLNIINSNNSVPTLFFHGTSDTTVPYGAGISSLCVSATGCDTLYGSELIAQQLESLNECYELQYNVGGGHGVYNSSYRSDITAQFLKRDLCDNCQQIIIEDQSTVIQNDSALLSCPNVSNSIDSDNDGVCDINDVCQGGNDNFDIDSNGVPDDCEPIMVNLKVVLEGAFVSGNGSQMTNELFVKDQIPLAHPYSAAPFNYTGTETLASIPSNMVDWILVEARTGPNPTNKIDTKVGILLVDGTITDVDGVSPLSFELPFGDSYYFVVRHRNHLDIMTSTSLTRAATITYDFTINTTQAFGASQQKIMSNGQAAMYAGDVDQNLVIQLTDFDAWKAQPAILNTYKTTDMNLDGIVQVTDYDMWFGNKAKIAPVELGY